MASPYGGRYCKLGSPAHLAQYLNVRDFSGVAEERVELCRIRLVEIGQECKQKQRLEREPSCLWSLNYLKSAVSSTTRKNRQCSLTEMIAGKRSPRKR